MPKRAFIGPDCVACGNCVKACPLKSIAIDRGMRAVIGERCVGCGRCAQACPAGVIEIREVGAREGAAV